MRKCKAVFRLTLSLLFVSLFVPSIVGQDFIGLYNNLKNRLKTDPVKIYGGISAGTDFLSTTDSLRQSAPFNYRLTANLNIDLLGINIPLSANFSNAKIVYGYQLPAYSFLGISPTYKWATLHLGDRSMTFSPYTLAGHNFHGIGTELAPGKFRFSAMRGRLQKPVQETISEVDKGPEPAYKRMGWGIKAGYDNGKEAYDLIIFHAKDDPNSIDSLTQHPTLRPAENLTLGLNGKKQFGNRISVAFEYALSAMTRDITFQEVTLSQARANSRTGFLFSRNLSTQNYNAFKSSIGFNIKEGTTFQLNYERVDPGYRTLGALFFNDNLENYTASGNSSFHKNKINLSGNFGVQRNNIDKSQINSGLRFVGALNANMRISDRINMSAAYSNFRNTSIRDVTIESLQNGNTMLGNTRLTSFITQVSQNANLSSSYIIGKEKKASISSLFSFQKANNIANDQVLLDQQTTFYTGSLSHAYSLTEIGMTFSSSFMLNYGLTPPSKILSLTPTIAVSKDFFEKTLKVNSSISYANSYVDENLANRIFSSQMGIKFSKFKNHPIGFNLRYVFRAAVPGVSTSNSLSEFSGNITYSYKFVPQLKKKK